MVHHVPHEKSKTVIFWLEREVYYMYRLYKKNFQIPSMGKRGKGRQFFANFLDYFQKISICIRQYIKDFFGNSLESWQTIAFPFPPFPRREFGNFSCIVYTHTKLHVQAKKSPFWIFHRGHDVSVSLPYCVKVMLRLLKRIEYLPVK